MKVRQRLAMVLALSTIFTTVPVTQVSATPREDIRVLTEKFNLVQVDKRDYTNPNIDVVATGFPDEIVIGESYNVSFEIRVDGEIPESYDVDASVIEYDENTDIYFENEHYDSDTGIYSFELYGESPGKAYVTLSYRYDVVYVVEMDVIGDVAERPYLESVYNEFTVVSGADLRLPIITNVPAEDIGVELSWQYSGEFEEDLTVEYRDGGYYLSSLAMPEGESYEQANLCLSFPDIYGDTLGAIIELEVLDKFEDDEQPIPLEIGYYIKDTYFVGDVVQLSFDWDKPNDDYWYQVPNENFVWWDFSEHDVMVEYPNAFTVTQPGTYRLTVTNFEQTHSDYKDITFLPRYDSGNSMLVTDISYASDNRSATVTILKPQDIEFFNLGNGLKVYSDNYSFTVYESGTYNIQYTDPITDSTVNVPIRINLDELSPTIYYIGTDEWNSVPEAIAIDSDRYLSHTMNGIEYRTNLAMVDEAYGTPIVFNNQDGGSCSFVMEIVESVEGFVEMNYNKNSTNKGMPIHVRDFSMGNIGVKDVEYMGEYFTYNNPVELKVTTASALSITTDSSISFEPAPLTSGYDNNGTVTYRGDGVYRICVQHSGGEYDYYVNVDARPDMSAIGTVLRNEDGTYSLDVKSPNADIIKVLFMDGTDYIPDRGMRRDFNLEFTGLESVEGSVNIVLVDENYNVMVVPYSQYYIPEPD